MTDLNHEVRRLVLEKTQWVRALGIEIGFACRELDPETKQDVLHAVARALTDPADARGVRKAIERLIP